MVYCLIDKVTTNLPKIRSKITNAFHKKGIQKIQIMELASKHHTTNKTKNLQNVDKILAKGFSVGYFWVTYSLKINIYTKQQKSIKTNFRFLECPVQESLPTYNVNI